MRILPRFQIARAIEPAVTIIVPTIPNPFNLTIPLVSALAPSTKLETIDAPVGIANWASIAAWVIRGARLVAIKRPTARTTIPTSKARKPLPRTIGVIKTNIQGMVARSPKGRTLLPGRITARKTAMGTRIKATVRVMGCPKKTAESKQIKICQRLMKR